MNTANQTQKDSLALTKNTSSFKLVIPENVEAKIRHLCSVVHDQEWSGTLFYTTKGSFDDGTFEAQCIDILVMDVGSSGATEFKDTPDIIAYRLEHGDTLLKDGVYEGLIHSHNNFKAFFSGVDESTLLSEGTDLNHFLSLIVCNKGEYVARITRKIKSDITAKIHIEYTKTIEYQTFGGKEIVLSSTNPKSVDKIEKKSDTTVEYFNLRIDKPNLENGFNDIDNRIAEIRASKREYVAGYFKSQEKPYFDSKGFVYNDCKDLNHEVVPANIIRKACVQIATGNIFAKPTLDLDSFVKNMDKFYTARFGDILDDEVESRIASFIDGMIDCVVGYTLDALYEDKLYKKYNLEHVRDRYELYIMPLYLSGIISYFEQLPKSEIKELIINQLNWFLNDNN